MAKMTLLEIVQEILNDGDGDEINSINDTVESSQVAEIVRSTFKAMTSNRNWPHSRKFITPIVSSSTSLPTHVTLPDGIKEIITVKYNKVKSGETKRKYELVRYKHPDDFLRILNSRNSDNSNIDIISDTSGIELLIKNDEAPTYYTSFDDEVMIFDSYDNTVDSSLREEKFQIYAYTMLDFVVDDATIPDLPEEAFTSLIEESKSKYQFKLRQFLDQKSEQEATRQRTWLSRKSWKVNGGIRYPDYGRSGKKHARSKEPTFRNEK